MEFLESPRFPACPRYGFESRPLYAVAITTLTGGQERRNRLWSRPLYEHTVTVGPEEEDAVQELLEFWHAVGGTAVGFRFKDFADFKSCRVGGTPTALDQPLQPLGTSPETYQLVKQYVAGARTQLRDIFKPVSGTVLVANELGAVQAADRWSLDTATGVLTPNGGFVGTPTSWGGEFDTPVRFNSDFPVQIVNLQIHAVSFALRELRL